MNDVVKHPSDSERRSLLRQLFIVQGTVQDEALQQHIETLIMAKAAKFDRELEECQKRLDELGITSEIGSCQ